MSSTFTFIDLFCGIGGFRLAMESICGICVFSSDKSRRARETYFSNFHEVPAGNITKIEAEDIPPFDVLCGGFPCQPFSMAGKKRGFEDKRGQMFFEIARIVKHHKPKALFLENVAHLIRHDGGRTFRVITETLDGLGYDVHYKVLAASDYGVAQIRKRVCLVCFRKDLQAEFSFPEPTFEDVAVEDFLESIVDESYFLDPDLVTFYKPDIETRTLDTYRLGYVGTPGQGRRVYSAKGVSATFVVSARGPCGGTEAYLVNGRVRRPTPAEAKRIMGFPEDFLFPVTDSKALELLGNSVAVPVLKRIAGQMAATGIFENQEDFTNGQSRSVSLQDKQEAAS